MFYEQRTYRVTDVDDAGELASMLTERDWTVCQAFRLTENLIFVNDSTGPNGAQEYAVLDELGQFDSITFGWMKVEDALEAIIRCAVDPDRSYLPLGATVRTDHDELFGRYCPLCE